MGNELLRVAEKLETAAPTQSSARTSLADPPAFDRALLGLLGSETTDPPEPHKAATQEAEPHQETDAADEQSDARLIALLPGLDLLARATDSFKRASTASLVIATAGRAAAAPQQSASGSTVTPVDDSVPAPAKIEPTAPPAALFALRAELTDQRFNAGIVGDVLPAAGSAKPDPKTASNSAAPAPVSASPTPTTALPATKIEMLAPGHELEVSSADRSSAMRLQPIAIPTMAELQARRQFAAQAAALAPMRGADAHVQEADMPAPARLQTSPVQPVSPVISELVARLAGGRADASAPTRSGNSTAGADTAGGVASGWSASGTSTASIVAAAGPDLAGADARAAWQQALIRHVGLIVAGETGEARLQIESGKLGPIEVRVKIDGERVDVRFSIQHPITASLVQEALPRLERMLEQQGFSLAHSSIDQGQSRQHGERDAQASARAAAVRGQDDRQPSATSADEAGLPIHARHRQASALLDDFA